MCPDPLKFWSRKITGVSGPPSPETSKKSRKGFPGPSGQECQKSVEVSQDLQKPWPSTEKKTSKSRKKGEKLAKNWKILFFVPSLWSIFPIFYLFFSYFLDFGVFLCWRWPRLLQPKTRKRVKNNVSKSVFGVFFNTFLTLRARRPGKTLSRLFGGWGWGLGRGWLTVCILGALQKRVDLQGLFVKIRDFSKFKGFLVELLKNRRSWENQKPPENRQKSGLFWASPFTMHLVCTLLKWVQQISIVGVPGHLQWMAPTSSVDSIPRPKVMILWSWCTEPKTPKPANTKN